MTREYDKLVRDRIPDVIRADGERPVTHAATGEEYRRRLREKLVEEATEFAEDGELAELADVLAVFDAMCDAVGTTPEEVRRLGAEKAAERGGFSDGVVLERVETDPTDGFENADSR
ncbi:nucleoside triphosphate pyrophosphohydrolase [Halogeometricum luteum]|uniref:Nucleoside triphosphate pyrophosphohydrolase n=1 Tax=Halogeometricum luteum TaxID=2950537 RepID=A0ABU2FY19_9EURY|nr:nucleoside triphosphate pyrophosphohydrolase [Halogeometricum sp. S3BR5-2]MDS0293432.1 nucleoside triphosphate pyrophosphohydrolase [Halogeometricum sp. S3BR5-2]